MLRQRQWSKYQGTWRKTTKKGKGGRAVRSVTHPCQRERCAAHHATHRARQRHSQAPAPLLCLLFAQVLLPEASATCMGVYSVQ